MSNMSYCRFGNTLGDLQDCLDTIQGGDDYYQSRDDISDEEFRNMESLIEVCREIVEAADNGDNVLVREGDGSSKDDDYED